MGERKASSRGGRLPTRCMRRRGSEGKWEPGTLRTISSWRHRDGLRPGSRAPAAHGLQRTADEHVRQRKRRILCRRVEQVESRTGCQAAERRHSGCYRAYEGANSPHRSWAIPRFARFEASVFSLVLMWSCLPITITGCQMHARHNGSNRVAGPGRYAALSRKMPPTPLHCVSN